MSYPSPVLEPAAQAFADFTASPPFLFDLSIEDGRKTVDSVQDGDVPAPAVEKSELVVAGGPTGQVSITIYRPASHARHPRSPSSDRHGRELPPGCPV